MAILDKLEATISVDGGVLPEYDCDISDESETSSTTSGASRIKKYVESQAGSRFSISFIAHPGQTVDLNATHLCWDIYFDGKYITCRLDKKILVGVERLERTVSRVEAEVEQKLHRKYFKFENLSLSQDHITIAEAQKYKDFGTIEVKVWAWQRTSKLKRTKGRTLYGELPTVPQKGVKLRGVTLGVGFDSEILDDCRKPSLSSSGEYVGPQPIAHFIFEYRTKESLKELNVIKLPPESTPAIHLDQRDPTTLNPQELLQLVEILKTKIKPETKPTLKRECSSTPTDGKNKKRVKTSMRIEDAISID